MFLHVALACRRFSDTIGFKKQSPPETPKPNRRHLPNRPNLPPPRTSKWKTRHHRWDRTKAPAPASPCASVPRVGRRAIVPRDAELGMPERVSSVIGMIRAATGARLRLFVLSQWLVLCLKLGLLAAAALVTTTTPLRHAGGTVLQFHRWQELLFNAWA